MTINLKNKSTSITEVIVLADVKLSIPVVGSGDDAMILSLIKSAREYAENYTGKSLAKQEWELSYSNFSGNSATLSYGPVNAITKITTFSGISDTTGIVLKDTQYSLEGDVVIFQGNYFNAYKMVIAYEAGYYDAQTNIENVPGMIKRGMMRHVNLIYRNEADDKKIKALCAQYYESFRVMGFGSV